MKNKILFILIGIGLLFPIKSFSLEPQLDRAPVSRPDGQNIISLDIKGMDIVDVLKMLATRSGMNLVVGKNVTGRVTLFLKNVDIWDAFEIIVSANDLAYEKQDNIINVMTQRDYELEYGERYQDKKEAKIIQLRYAKAAELAKSLNQIRTNLGKIVVDEVSNTLIIIDSPQKIKEAEAFILKADMPMQTLVFSLNYAQADKLQVKLQEALTRGAGSIRIDERTNKILVTDYPEKLKEIAKIIKAFDEKTPQVLIDAQVIELKPSDQFQMGVDWNYWIEKYFQVQASLPINTSNALLIGTTSATPKRVGQYKAVIDMLRTIGDTKILSSPRIMVLNNQEAKIMVGTKDAYITSTTTQGGSGNTVTAQSVNFVDTGIKLHVTPTINRDGFVIMKIKPEISSAESKSLISEDKKTDVPIVTTSEAETTVMVQDGITIIIGGLRKDKRTKTEKKIPILADIPWLGMLFKSTDDKIEKTELVILLTPHIMSGKDTFSDFAEIKPIDGAIAKFEKGDIIIDKVKSPKDKLEFLNTIDYHNLIFEQVKTIAMNNRPNEEKGEVALFFTISKNGYLLSGPSILKTTNPALNEFAMQAIEDASPFLPFPKALKKEQEAFKISLSYE